MIDPDYCRVLFYLDLDALQHMIVDMQIQNRIMTIHVTNEHTDLTVIAAPLIGILKEKCSRIWLPSVVSNV